MTSTPDTPQERDEKADDLASGVEALAASEARTADRKAAVLIVEREELALVLRRENAAVIASIKAEVTRAQRESRTLYALAFVVIILMLAF